SPCTPIPTAKPPIGFYFDAKTGMCVFMANQYGEFLITVNITEWRKDSIGNQLKIGESTKEIVVSVFDCAGNDNPIITSSTNKTKFEVCEGEKVSFSVNGI